MKHFSTKLSLVIVIGVSFLYTSKAQININKMDNLYTETFDGLANSGTTNSWADNITISGVSIFNSGATKISIYKAGTGSDNNGSLYSFGSAGSIERALGSIVSNSTGDIYYGIQLKNETGATIKKIKITYTGEQWRNGGNTTPQKLSFSYQIGATNLSTGVWTDISTLDFITPIATSTAGLLDGNNSANRKTIVDSFDVVIPIGQTIFLRWKDGNDAGNDHALAMDDFSVTARSSSTGGGTPTPATWNNRFDPCSLGMGKWQEYSITGAQKWICSTYGRNKTNGIEINGFSGGALGNEDWLISPNIDLSSYNYPILSFWSISAFNGPKLKLKISTNYSGTGDPTTATWTDLNCILPNTGSNEWKQSTNIDISDYKMSNVCIAFVYTSSPTEGASRWTIDDIDLTNSTTPPSAVFNHSITPLTDLHFNETYFPNASPSKKININTLNFTSPLKISVNAPFELSKDNSTFNPTLTFAPSDLKEEKNIYLRFKPTTTDSTTYSSQIIFEYETTKQRVGYITGSSIDPATTFDIVPYNIEWFGSATNGPTDNDKQLENVKTVMVTLDADIYGIEEVSSDTKLAELISKLPGYDYILSDYYSYYFDGGSDYQKIGFIYKKSTVKILQSKVLLKNLYEEIRAGKTSLTGYPDDSNRFWASGRLPFLIEAEITMNGKKDTINIIDIHARANTSGEEEKKYKMRQYDVNVLKDTLDKYYQDKKFILLGDFNDDLDETVSRVTSKESTYKNFVDDITNYNPVSKKLSDQGLRSYISMENVIDHIIISRKIDTLYLDQSVYPFIPFDLIPNYQSTTSDHLPIVARFKLLTKPTITLSDKKISIKHPNEVYRNSSFIVSAEGDEIPNAIYQWSILDDANGKIIGPSNKKEIIVRASPLTNQLTIQMVVCIPGECIEPLTATIQISENPIKKLNTVSIYPKQVEKNIYITNLPERTTNATVEIFSFQGVKVSTQSVINDSIDLSALASGLYILRIHQDGQPTYQERIYVVK